MVHSAGLEPATSSVSTKCSTTELRMRCWCSHQDLNPGLLITNQLLYRLNYRSEVVPSERFELPPYTLGKCCPSTRPQGGGAHGRIRNTVSSIPARCSDLLNYVGSVSLNASLRRLINVDSSTSVYSTSSQASLRLCPRLLHSLLYAGIKSGLITRHALF